MSRLDVAGERMELLPERALLWPARGAGGAVIVADMHLGKVSTFKALGVPLGDDLDARVARADLARLGGVIQRTGARELVILGDLLHAREAKDPGVLDAFARWREAFPPARLSITLVRGNHDRRAGDPPQDWGLRCVDEGVNMDPFVLAHDPAFTPRPASPPGAYMLAGHIHPAVTLDGSTHSERAACFWFGPRVGVLPAFGSFTGSARVSPRPGDRVFAVGGVGPEVIQVRLAEVAQPR